MRLIVIFILLILVSSGLYTAYGILSFEPEKPQPLVFKEPDPQSLIQLGILPSDYSASKVEAPPLTPEQQKRADIGFTKVSQAMGVYQGYEKNATPRLRETLSIINGTIGSGLMPGYFLNVKDVLRPERSFSMLKFDPKATLETSGTTPLNCNSRISVMIGDDADNTISCTATETDGDRIFLGGPGNDIISDTLGDRIINGGSGDDTITLGPGRTIIVLQENWGKDTVTIDCSGAAVAPNEVPQDFPVPWVAKYTNFIVMSPRISQSGVKWQGNVLTDTATGDTLTVNENCFNLVANK